jgi:hypothetical protein
MSTFESPLLGELFASFPALGRWRREIRGTVLEAVQDAQRPTWPARRISPALRKHMGALAASILGSEAGALAERHLSGSPHVLMAHHHGINCHPEFIQSTLMFGLPRLTAGENAPESPPGLVPVLACSSVALRSFSFPRGLLLARHSPGGGLVRLPLFPSSAGDLMVCAAPPLRLKQLQSALRQWQKLDLSQAELRAASALVEEYVMTPDLLGLPSYSEQVTRINAAVWRGLCGKGAPELLFLDLESVTAELLKEALLDEDSLLHKLLLHGPARRELYAALAGAPGCWPADDGNGSHSQGTAFFWLAQNGERRRLRLRESPEPALTYNEAVIPLTRDALLEGLEKKLLIPGLYCSCLLLNHVHGLVPHGGIYMGEYEPRMHRATDAVAGKLGLLPSGGPAWAAPVLGTGFMPFRMRANKAWACGLVELLANRSELARALRQIGDLPADRACLFSLADWWLEISEASERPAGWTGLLARIIAAAEGCGLPANH